MQYRRSWNDRISTRAGRGILRLPFLPENLSVSFGRGKPDKIQIMSILQFNGTASDYIEIADSADFSVAGTFTASAWMRPDVLTFPNSESTGYVHWMGKGETAQQEWTFRMVQSDDYRHSTSA
jgi:hypothetical protein